MKDNRTLLDLQEAGEAPEWYTQASLKTVQGGYLLEGETPRDMYLRVSRAAADRLHRWDLEAHFFNILWKGWLGLATPVAANMGAERGLPISCFSSYVPDTINGIFDTLREVAVMSAKGGGTASLMSPIRHKRAPIHSGGYSNGVTYWAKIYNEAIYRVSQGSLRRGAHAIYLDIDHADYLDFLKQRKPNVNPEIHCPHIHQGAVISDDFMHRIKEGHQESRGLWLETLNTRLQTGEPYLFFKDNANKANPPWYKDKGLEVKQSNLCCLLGDELVVTKDGNVPIAELVGKEVEIWDGDRWVAVNNFESKGFAEELIEVTFENGVSMKTTLNHRFPLALEKGYYSPYIMSYGWDLEAGDKVIKHDITNKIQLEDYQEGVRVVEVKKVNVETTEVFCCNVPSTGLLALANGLMTGNSEITLHTDEEHSFVCCLSSLNISKYDEWRNTDTIYLAIWFLDAVMEEFIQKAKTMAGMERAVRFAEKSRALGLGVLGYHTYLQSKRWAFGSDEAYYFNRNLFKEIKQESERATRDLAEEYGEPEWCKGHGVRNSHCLASAPTVSNSIICGGVSAGIEPITSNAYIKDSAKGLIQVRNQTLKQLLAVEGLDTAETWEAIVDAKGSIAGLDLPEDIKEVFKTAREIDQMHIVKQAGQRQLFIDQGQSVNLFFPANVDSRTFNKVHLAAWEEGLKALYYCRSQAVIDVDKASRTTSLFVDTKQTSDNGSCSIKPPEAEEGICIPCSG